MSDQNVSVRLDVKATGTAPADLRAMAKDAQELASQVGSIKPPDVGRTAMLRDLQAEIRAAQRVPAAAWTTAAHAQTPTGAALRLPNLAQQAASPAAQAAMVQQYQAYLANVGKGPTPGQLATHAALTSAVQAAQSHRLGSGPTTVGPWTPPLTPVAIMQPLPLPVRIVGEGRGPGEGPGTPKEKQDEQNKFWKQAGIAALASVAVTTHFAQSFARMADVATNSFLTPDQRTAGIAHSLPVVGGLVKGLDDFRKSASGMTDALRVHQAEWNVRNAGVAAQVPLARELEGLTFREQGARTVAETYRGGSNFKATSLSAPPAPENIREYAQYERRLPLEQSRVQAERGAFAAREQHAEASARFEAQQAKVLELKRQADRSEIALGKQRVKPLSWSSAGAETQGRIALQQAENKYAADLLALQNALAVSKDLSNRKQETAIDLAKKESEVRKSSIALDRAKLEDVKEREGLRRGEAQHFGMTNAAQRQLTLQAALQAKAHGFESLVDQQKSRLAAAFPEYAQREAIKAGEASPEIQRAREALGIKGTLAEASREKVETQVRITNEIVLDEKKFADEVRGAMSEFVKEFRVLMVETVNAVRRQAEFDQIRKNANGG